MKAKEALEKCERIIGNSFDGLYPTDEIEKIVQPIREALNEYEQLRKDFTIFIEGIESKLKRFREELK